MGKHAISIGRRVVGVKCLSFKVLVGNEVKRFLQEVILKKIAQSVIQIMEKRDSSKYGQLTQGCSPEVRYRYQ
jgi:hypothetical protein